MDGKLACLAEEKDGMKLVDASSPSQFASPLSHNEDIFTMTQLMGHYAYAIGSCGLYIWDITNPRTPTASVNPIRSKLSMEALEVDDNYLYTGAGYLKSMIFRPLTTFLYQQLFQAAVIAYPLKNRGLFCIGQDIRNMRWFQLKTLITPNC